MLSGVKFPTGVDDRKNNEGEELEAVEQPGSGSYMGCINITVEENTPKSSYGGNDLLFL